MIVDSPNRSQLLDEVQSIAIASDKLNNVDLELLEALVVIYDDCSISVSRGLVGYELVELSEGVDYCNGRFQLLGQVSDLSLGVRLYCRRLWM